MKDETKINWEQFRDSFNKYLNGAIKLAQAQQREIDAGIVENAEVWKNPGTNDLPYLAKLIREGGEKGKE